MTDRDREDDRERERDRDYDRENGTNGDAKGVSSLPIRTLKDSHSHSAAEEREERPATAHDDLDTAE